MGESTERRLDGKGAGIGGGEREGKAKSYGRSDDGIDTGKRVVTKTEEDEWEVAKAVDVVFRCRCRGGS